MDWGRKLGFELVGGKGAKHGGIYFVLGAGGGMEMKPFQLYEGFREAYIYLGFTEMGSAFSQPDQRVELCERVNRLDGVKISAEKGVPGFGFSKLRREGALKTLLEALEWMVEQIRATGVSSGPSSTDASPH